MKMIRHKAICEAFCFLTEIPRSQCFKNIFGPLVVSEKRSTVLGANSDAECLVRSCINLFRKANIFSFEVLHDSRRAAHRGCRFWPALRTNGRRGGRPYGLSLSQKFQRFFNHPINGDAEFFVENLVRRRGPEMIEAHHVSFLADITPPTLSPPRFYGDARFDLP